MQLCIKQPFTQELRLNNTAELFHPFTVRDILSHLAPS